MLIQIFNLLKSLDKGLLSWLLFYSYTQLTDPTVAYTHCNGSVIKTDMLRDGMTKKLFLT